MKTYFRILSYSKPYGSFLPFLVPVVLLSVVFGVLNFGIFAPILNVLFDADQMGRMDIITELPPFELSKDWFKALGNFCMSWLIVDREKTDSLFLICVVLVISVFLSNLFTFLASHILSHVKGRVIRHLRMAVYQKLLAFHPGYFNEQRRGDVISRTVSDVQEVENTIIATMVALIKEPLTVLLTFIALFYMSAKLTIFTLVLLPLSATIISTLTRRLKGKSKKGQDFIGRILGMVDETIGGIRVIKGFNAESFYTERFEETNSIYGRTVQSIESKRGMASPLSQFMGVTVVAVIMYYGGSLVLKENWEMAPATFFTYIILFASVISPIKAVSTTISNIQRGLVAGSRIFELLDATPQIQDEEHTTPLKEFNEGVTFENVSFAYEEGTNVLKNINLTIPKGKTVALVGPSGGGKSTMMDLLPRFQDPSAGAVKIDRQDIRDCSQHDVRALMGIVTQEAILFNDTVYNNIAFGTEATMEEVEEAAKMANAHEFIVNLEEGYQTVVGDRGMKLSGGQRQRLTIARAILRNPEILLLDEATSALDSESEKLVQKALEELMRGRTSVVIAHRLSTIHHADIIVVLRQGEIVEQGTHDELLALGGLYEKLSKMQSVS